MRTSLPRAALKHQTAIRAFIHTSARACARSKDNSRRPPARDPAQDTWNWLDPFLESPNHEQLQPQANETLLTVPQTEADPLNSGYVRKNLWDPRAKKWTSCVFPKPGFSLHHHSLSAHPSLKGLALERGTAQPVAAPVVVHRLVMYARDQQLQAAEQQWQGSPASNRAKTSVGRNVDPLKEWHWNLPASRRRAWRDYWSRFMVEQEAAFIQKDLHQDYETMTYVKNLWIIALSDIVHRTYVGLSQTAPDYKRGNMSAILTCLLPADIAMETESVDSLSWLGLPNHILELLFALSPAALGSVDRPVLPTVTRISPARYVLTFESQRSRDALLRHWKRFSSRILDETSRMPPFRMQADGPERQPTQAPEQGFNVRVDAAGGGLWLGTERFARVQDLANLVHDRAARSAASLPRKARTELLAAAPAPSPIRQSLLYEIAPVVAPPDPSPQPAPLPPPPREVQRVEYRQPDWQTRIPASAVEAWLAQTKVLDDAVSQEVFTGPRKSTFATVPSVVSADLSRTTNARKTGTERRLFLEGRRNREDRESMDSHQISKMVGRKWSNKWSRLHDQMLNDAAPTKL